MLLKLLHAGGSKASEGKLVVESDLANSYMLSLSKMVELICSESNIIIKNQKDDERNQEINSYKFKY